MTSVPAKNSRRETNKVTKRRIDQNKIKRKNDRDRLVEAKRNIIPDGEINTIPSRRTNLVQKSRSNSASIQQIDTIGKYLKGVILEQNSTKQKRILQRKRIFPGTRSPSEIIADMIQKLNSAKNNSN